MRPLRRLPFSHARPLWAALVAFLGLLVWQHRFPSQDGPAHLYNTLLLLDLWRGTASGPAAALHEINPFLLFPNWSGTLGLAGLLQVAHPALAERILVGAIVVGSVFAFWYAARAVGTGTGNSPEMFGLPAFMLIVGTPLHWGFYSFCIGVGLSLWIAGYWARHAARPGSREGLVLSLSLVLAYASSIIAWGAAVVLVTAITWDAWRDGLTRRRVAVAAFALAPGMGLSLLFLARQNGEPAHLAITASEVGRRLYSLARMDVAVAYLDEEAMIVGVVGMMLIALAVFLLRLRWRRGGRERGDGFLAAAAVFGLLATLAPDALAGGGFFVPRMMLMFWLCLLLWMGGQPLDAYFRPRIQIGAMLAVCFLLGLRGATYSALNEDLRDYVASTTEMEVGSTFLPLTFSPEGRAGSSRALPLLHAWGWVAVERGGVSLFNWQPAMGYFPVVYRPGREAHPALAEFLNVEEGPIRLLRERVDLVRPGVGGMWPDYVLVWDVAPGSERIERSGSWVTLEAAYETSEPRANGMRMYRHRPSGDSR
jgi:hypothetical protein